MLLKQDNMAKSRLSASPQKGSEHGQDNIEEAMKIAEMKGLKAVLIEGKTFIRRWKKCWIPARLTAL